MVQSNEGHDVAVFIIGAGPAGLSAAFELSRASVACQIVDADNVVGGISRTVEYKGFLFDIGGHRFFTKVQLIEDFWQEVLGEDFLTRPRLSRIVYQGKLYDYPLRLQNVIANLGLLESTRCGLSYILARILPQSPEPDFETWVSNRFGRRLYGMFFKTYAEKVWGIPCTEIRAEWAAQRIQGLSLLAAVLHALTPATTNGKQSSNKTLIHEFQYPRRGPGMLWNKVRDIVQQRGCAIAMNSSVEQISWRPGRVESVTAGGVTYAADHFISSMPIQELIRALDPPPPGLESAARNLAYRDFLTVAIIVRKRDVFADNWIYVHDSRLKVGRIQNFKNWSPEMVPDDQFTSLGLEYFCFEGDSLWTTSDEDLIELAKSEVEALGLAKASEVTDGTVVRMKKAYPVYDGKYKEAILAVREFLKQVPNLQLIGRNGMHHYNNQDHSALTGILAARNILGEEHDLWQVNVDEDYHEKGTRNEDLERLRKTQPRVPSRLGSSAGT